MAESQERSPRPDDTAAFRRFYEEGSVDEQRPGLLYRLLVGWWRARV